jgi:hypothetical protein
VLVSFVYVVACRFFALVLLLGRSDGSKELEIVLLRHEPAILQRHTPRPQLTARDRLVLPVLNRVLPRRLWQASPITHPRRCCTRASDASAPREDCCRSRTWAMPNGGLA